MTAGLSRTPFEREPPSWRAVLGVPIAIAAIFTGMLVYVLGTAVRDAVTTAPVHAPGFAGVAVHGPPPVLTLLSTFAQDLALVGGVGIAVAASVSGRLRPSALGLRPTNISRAFWLVIGSYVLFLVFTAVWTSVLDVSARENVAVDLGTRDSPVALLGAMLLVCAVAPIAEELFFRGFLFGGLRRYGLVPAALITGVLFGFAHVASSPIGFLGPLAVLGVVLCLLYERTGSLYPSIALHCLNNSIAFGVADGRGWLVPVCIVVAGAAIVVVLRTVVRALDAPAAGSPATRAPVSGQAG